MDITYVCGLKNILKENELIPEISVADLETEINEFCIRLSKLSIKASLNIHYRIYELVLHGTQDEVDSEFRELEHKDRQIFLQDFKNPENISEMSIDRNIDQLDHGYSSNSLIYAAQRYQVNMNNNIVTHGRSMVGKYFQMKLEEQNPQLTRAEKNAIVKKIVRYLFDYFNDVILEEPLQLLINEFYHQIMRPSFHQVSRSVFLRAYFYNSVTEEHWYQFVPIFIRMQWAINRYNMNNRNNQKKSFRVVPIFTFTRKHTHYDTRALCSRVACVIHKMNENRPRNQQIRNLKQNDRRIWGFLYYDKFKRNTNQFNFYFTTDGISISLHFKKINRNNNAMLNTQTTTLARSIPAHIRERFNYYDVMVGVDPGKKLIAAGTLLFADNSEKNFELSNEKYKAYAKYKFRHRKRKIMTAQVNSIFFLIFFLNENTFFNSEKWLPVVRCN